MEEVMSQQKDMLSMVRSLDANADSDTLNEVTEKIHLEAAARWSEMESNLWVTFGLRF